jgi:hypothetical protein
MNIFLEQKDKNLGSYVMRKEKKTHDRETERKKERKGKERKGKERKRE